MEKEWEKLAEPVLRALIREAVHHGVETRLYPGVEGKRGPFPVPAKVRKMLAVYKQRGFSMEHEDLAWALKMIDLAEQFEAGSVPAYSGHQPAPFSPEDLGAVDRVIYRRRSIRQWTTDPVPRENLEEIVRAGIWASTGCDLQVPRYIMVDDPKDLAALPSREFSGETAKIITAIDSRPYEVLAHLPRRNMLLDVGAAMQNMLLMAEALGLGAVWGTLNDREMTNIRAHFQLEEYFTLVAYISLGWPAERVLPPGRISVADAVLNYKGW